MEMGHTDGPRDFRVPVPFFFQLSSTPTFLVLGLVGMGCPSSLGKNMYNYNFKKNMFP